MLGVSFLFFSNFVRKKAQRFAKEDEKGVRIENSNGDANRNYRNLSENSPSFEKISLESTISKRIILYTKNILIVDTEFLNLSSKAAGGAVFYKNTNSSFIGVSKCKFDSCYSGTSGGAMSVTSSDFFVTKTCFSHCSSSGPGFVCFVSASNLMHMNDSVIASSKSNSPSSFVGNTQKFDCSRFNISYCDSGNNGVSGFHISCESSLIYSTSFVNLTGKTSISSGTAVKFTINFCNFVNCKASNAILFSNSVQNFEIGYSNFLNSPSITVIFSGSAPHFVQCAFDSSSTRIDSSAILESCITGAVNVKTHDLNVETDPLCYGEVKKNSSDRKITVLPAAIIGSCILLITCFVILFYCFKPNESAPIDNSKTWEQMSLEHASEHLVDETELVQ